jgi:putative SOS response-associated peptidase YedK
MCGRYASVSSTGDLIDEFDLVSALGEELAPSWNIAPTDPVRIVVQRPADDGTQVRELHTARWGLVPSWSKDAKGAARMINARSETVTEKPAFKKAAGARRCVVPALGYYEWQQDGAAKVPWFLHDPDERPLAFAGLYAWWRDPAKADDDPDRWLLTCTIITQAATDLLGQIHDRTPVLLTPEARGPWLDCSDGDPATAARLIGSLPEARLAPYVVGTAVGNVRNNGPQLIAPA